MILRAICLSATLIAACSAQAQTTPVKTEVSDRVLKTLKSLAWQSLPSKIVQPDKKVVEIDKSDPSKIVIPDQDAREIVRAAHLTARAHKCDLQELVVANRDAILGREKQKAKWSEGQLQYINALHLFTVQLLVGKIDVNESAAPKANYDSKALPMPKDSAAACSEKEQQEILALVEANEKLVKKS